MKLSLLFIFLVGCYSNPVPYDPNTEVYPHEDPLPCDEENPCVDSINCVGMRAEEEPSCGMADESGCVQVEVRDGLDCFPTADGTVRTGKCMAGSCVRE